MIFMKDIFLKTTILQIILCLSFNILLANSNNDLFEKANKAYSKGDYTLSKKLYNNILIDGECSSELYFNLANTYFKLDSIPQAILYYEKAKILSPSDEDIEHNLKIANAKTIDKIEVIPQLFFVSWFQSILNFFSTNTWAWLSVISSILCFSLYGFYLRSINNSIKKISFYLGSILCITCIGLIFITNAAHNSNKSMRAVVFAASVTLKSEPNANSTSLFVVHEGATCKILEQLDNWFRVKLDNGNEGWLPSSDIQKI